MLFTLLLASIPFSPLPQEATQEPAPAEAPAKAISIRPWMDRHLLVLLRELPVRANVEILKGSPETETVLKGKIQVQGPSRFKLALVSDLLDPTTGQMSQSLVNFHADGENLFMESLAPGAPPQVDRASLAVIAELKFQRTQRGADTSGLDPLDLFFDYTAFNQFYKFDYDSQSTYEGRDVFVFRGSPLDARDIPAEARGWITDRANTAEVMFDARTGLILFFELRGPSKVYARRKLTNIEYPERFPTSHFMFDVPPGTPMTNMDERLMTELNAFNGAGGQTQPAPPPPQN